MAGPAEKTKRPRSDNPGRGRLAGWHSAGERRLTLAGGQSNGHAAIGGLGETPGAPVPILAVAMRPRHWNPQRQVTRHSAAASGPACAPPLSAPVTSLQQNRCQAETAPVVPDWSRGNGKFLGENLLDAGASCVWILPLSRSGGWAKTERTAVSHQKAGGRPFVKLDQQTPALARPVSEGGRLRFSSACTSEHAACRDPGIDSGPSIGASVMKAKRPLRPCVTLRCRDA